MYDEIIPLIPVFRAAGILPMNLKQELARMEFHTDMFFFTMLGTSCLYSLILLLFSVFKKNKTMMSAPFITLAAVMTGLQLTCCLEWHWSPGAYPMALYHILFALEYLLSYFAAAAFYWYSQTYLYALRHPEVRKRPAVESFYLPLVISLGLVAVLVFATSLSTGWLFTFDEAGSPRYTAAYILLFSMACVWPVMNVIQLIRGRKVLPTGLFLLMLTYSIVPSLLFAVDALCDLSLGPVSLALMLFIIYARIDNAQSVRLVEQKALLAAREAEMTQTKMELMMSQIQPHFLYNALSSIASLCTEDPAEAERATNEFSHYLRGNLQSIGAKVPIPFEMELNHVEEYLRIEKRRFSDRLNIVYDIREKDFRIPALTLQTLVDNAVRYSVSAKYEPTTVTIAAESGDSEYLVRIIDDGPGFDPNEKPSDDRRHIGLAGARYRLAEMMNGRLEIQSELGHGTTVTIHIPKEAQE